ncbi:sushi domain-containing protein 1-like isoform X5 [Seriola dumerili]|uniref:sushi domain-containing protein 1-like isoform X5 n=1 Tax=Seriola dumerili TaxID=41447 RepID=UPI000BBEB87A|nr:sushi domain-containing protein 1-like isoform X5 [Seriola dumerili]
MIVVFLLCVFAGVPTAGQTLDVCATCHVNARCDDKADGSGKVCNCKYGFVGNGRTYCQDKDECQIGASRICGQHTTCHNTYGSYFCKCLSGYSPSNNMDVFIPNDGTHCQDIDECRISGQCGEGGQCRNMEGSFECSCQLGYRVHNGAEPFHPDTDKASCKVVDCGQPASVEDTVLLSFTGTTYGSEATFVCDEGFIWVSGDNISVCGANGLWRGSTIVCEEVDCGSPPALPHSHMLWNKSSRIGTEVVYQCNSGYHNVGKGNVSICTAAGQWEEPPVLCQAKCGPVPFLANSEVVWHKRSVVIHRCVEGYHSWRGSNVSVCGVSGVWQEATLRCIEIKPPINHLNILNEKCLHWKAEKYEEDTEDYKVTYVGSRDYQRSFHDKRKRLLSSKADQLELCLNLLPVTNYSISITAVSARFTATITTNTSLPVPPAPVVYYREFETPIPTLRLRRSANTLDPISLYQVFVLPIEEIMLFDCSSPGRPDPSRKSKSSSEYITAQIRLTQVGTEMNFTVGDGLYYGGFYNAPLENGRNYYIILRAVSHWKTALKSSCVLWAKIGGTSYVLKVSSLSAAASVGLVALAILVGYSCIWFFKRT